MKQFLLLTVALCLTFGSAQAGPNSNGAIIVHTNDSYTYNSLTVCTTTLGQPANCAAAITTTSKATAAVVWFMAAFLPTASPAVASVYFGINFDDVNLDPSTKFAPCGPGGTVEAPDTGWPGNAAGNSVGLGSPVVGNTLFRFYYFKVDEFLGSAGPFLCSAVNPTGGFAAFYDNGFPPAQDDITSFGCVRWYAAGQNNCPQVQASGACCLPDGSCTVTAQIDCAAPGIWHSEWTTCTPINPCPQPQAACCATNGSCTITAQAACAAPSVWHADWPSCDANPCPQPPLPAPTLLTPADAANCVAINGTVDWSDVTDATGYKVRIAVNCGAGVENVVTASQFSYTNLLPDTIYYWQVATKNISGIYGDYSACFSFRTAPTLLAAPTLQTPTNGAICQPASGTLDWSDVATAAGYRVQIGTTPSAGPEYDVTSSQYAYSGLSPDTFYYWRVQTKDACGNYGAYSGSFGFTTAVATLPAPTLQSPGNGAICIGTSGTLNWSDVAGVVNYRVQIGTSCGTGTEYDVSVSQYDYTGLVPNTTYYWRVKTQNSCGEFGNYSDCFAFVTNPGLLSAPALQTPADGATGVALNPVLDWADVTGATGYMVQLGTTCGTGAEVDLTASEWSPAPLSPGTTYYWRVKTKNICGEYGTYSSCFSFTATACDGLVLAAPELQIPSDLATCVAPGGASLNWADVPGATGYRVQFGTSCGSGSEHDVGSSQYSSAGGLAPSTTYYWRVRTKNCDNVYGDYSACFSFTTGPGLLSPPALQTPADGAINQPLAGVTLNWGDVTGAAGYTVQLGTTCGTGAETEVAASQYDSGPLTLGTVYYWRVKTKNACNEFGNYSACFSFTTEQPPSTGACCNTATGDCSVTTEGACSFTWLGAATVCSPANCPAPPPPTGACCDTATGACSITTQAACSFTWLGAATVCSPANCPVPPPPTGACCDTATGDCSITTQAACSFTWLGAATVCNSTTCPVPAPTGACCNTATGACAVRPEADCPYTWFGAGTVCSPANCPVPPPPTGACCDTATGDCSITTQAACNFTWLGAATACSPASCPAPAPTGACCNIGTGACAITTEAGCIFSWLGAGSICSPATCPAPPSDCVVKIVYPKGGQNLKVGNQYQITWTRTDCGANVQIDLFRDDVLCLPIAASTENDGAFLWTAIQCDGHNMGYKVRVTDLGSGRYAESLTYFTISVGPTTVNVTSPNGGEDLVVGQHQNITWNVENNGPTVKIDLLQNDAVCLAIAASAPNTGSFDWTVDRCLGQDGYKVRVKDISFGISDDSDLPFRIAAAPLCEIILTTPPDRAIWPRASAQDIRWDPAATCGGNVKIDLLKRTNGVYEFCMPIVGSTPNDGSYSWAVERCGSATARFRVRITNLTSGTQDQSNGFFSIPNPGQPLVNLSMVSVPNPFRQNALITLELPDDANVQAGIYNVNGQLVRSLIDQALTSGHYEIPWDGKDFGAVSVPSGIYYLRTLIDDEQTTKKILLIH
jgi:hypothetical protein